MPNESGAYDTHYRRMVRFYAAGLVHPTDATVVGRVVHEAYLDQAATLRYVCSWGGVETVAGRARMSDADWVGLGTIEDDDTYFRRFQELFALDIAPHT